MFTEQLNFPTLISKLKVNLSGAVNRVMRQKVWKQEVIIACCPVHSQDGAEENQPTTHG